LNFPGVKNYFNLSLRKSHKMVTKNVRYLLVLLVIGLLFASCSKKTLSYFINEWDIEDIEFINVNDRNVKQLENVFKDGGYIVVNKEHKYFIHTPNVNYGGTWYFSKDDKDVFYTVNNEGDTTTNKIEILTKNKMIIQTNDPETPIRFTLAPKK